MLEELAELACLQSSRLATQRVPGAVRSRSCVFGEIAFSRRRSLAEPRARGAACSRNGVFAELRGRGATCNVPAEHWDRGAACSQSRMLPEPCAPEAVCSRSRVLAEPFVRGASVFAEL